MKILTPIKRVVDPYAKVKPLSDGSALDKAGIKADVNPFDEIAVEEAVRLREAGHDVTIVAVSIGPTEVEEQLRKVLAMGADEAILVETTDRLDPTVVAAELKAVVEEVQPDLILMGKQATEEDNNQSAQMLAAKLGWPQATFASKVELGDGTVTVTRETDTGEETLLLPLPAIVTTDLRLNEPRFIALPGIVKARSKPLEKRPRATDVAPRTTILKMETPPKRSAGVKVANVDELLSSLREKGVLK